MVCSGIFGPFLDAYSLDSFQYCLRSPPFLIDFKSYFGFKLSGKGPIKYPPVTIPFDYPFSVGSYYFHDFYFARRVSLIILHER
jgi:hypothetical protein